MNAPPKPVHSPFGGSAAGRILRCPASASFIARVPEHLRRSSTYANRGTALHVAMPRLIERECSLDDLVGETIGDYALTRDDTENALQPALVYVEALLDQPGAEYYIEHHVIFPAVANTFGTCDLIIRIGRAAYLIDYKFGSGVPVRAIYPDGDVDVINAQLLFYAAAARHSMPTFFAGVDTFVLVILQPQSIELDAEMASSVTVTHAELDEFIAAYRAACEEALSPSPRLERGTWCRFCAAKPICPAHTGPLLDLAQFVVPTPPAGPADRIVYLQALAVGLGLADATKDICTALRDQAKRALEQGDSVPGFTLSAGRAERHWRDDEGTTIAALQRLGLSHDDIIAEAMRSPKQVELRAKARGLKVPKELIVSHPSGVSLVRIENARAPVPGRSELVRLFSEAFENVQKEDEHYERS
jgi:Protein of unknown function (DUF2800)